MHSMIRIALMVPLVVLGTLLQGCASKPVRMSLAVPLDVRITDPLAKAVPAMPSNPKLKLFLADIKDDRADKAKIGENREEDELGARPVTSEGPSVSEFIRGVFTRELSSIGLTPIATKADANRVLEFSLSQFFVIETGTYKAEISGTVTLKDGAGAVLYSGLVRGDNSTFGRSFSAENYQQVLSNATTEVLENLLKTAEFASKLKVD